jgi:hypothetical protein
VSFVKVLEDVFPADVRKAFVKVTSTFTEPVNVTVRAVQADGFFLDIEPQSFRLNPGESRIVELTLNPATSFLAGTEKQVRLVFSTSTYVTTEAKEATLVMRFKRVRSAFDVDKTFTLGGPLLFLGFAIAFSLGGGMAPGFGEDKVLGLGGGMAPSFGEDKVLGLGGGMVGSVT